MKKIIVLVIVFLAVSCVTQTIFFNIQTKRPLEKLDSLGIVNKIQIQDTLFWDKSYYRTDEGMYYTRYWSVVDSKDRYVMSIGKLQTDSIWDVRFRKERKR